ncbi:MAG: YXWGXW repeat-containing protein [Proteobacteria bacterium]|nr:YXWGXW repeat-containing protein [Pseudomonadota bacterium]MBU4470370.1 YXWGXW repeat-containing protein [Pseudomonadota bacterium]MCG2752781.1 hypothetical protein [Desulfobacteraceae bacterium]
MKTAMITVMVMVLLTGGLNGEAVAQAPPVPYEEQPEVLTRGPLNEAFAQPVNLEIQAGLIAPNRPPADIEEILPAQRPAGDQFAWVPGYWAWDSDRNDYLWVSGCWRAVPPDMNWVPGYWSQTRGGWQWVSGFWAPIRNTEINYLPAPPELSNVEAPGPPPSANRIWVPPCWYWHQGQYVRRPGYWIAAQTDWVWVPSHYIRTPRGYVFAYGHWDYPLERRGVLFAPVYFPEHRYDRSRISYALGITVNIGHLTFSLFSRPQYSHYYFGDYYDKSYLSIGIFPWFEFEQRHTWYDPIYVHDRWRHQKNNPRWEHHKRQEYDRRRADHTLRPPRTYREMESRVSKMPEPQRRNFEMAEPITRVAKRNTTAFKFEEIKPEARKKIAEHSQDVHQFVQERSQWETKGDKSRKADRTDVAQPQKPERKDIPPPVKRQKPGMKTTEPSKPEPVRSIGGREAQDRSREKQPTLPEPQKQEKASTRQVVQNQPDKVKIRTSPVAGKPDKDFLRKNNPAQPAEEQNNLKEKGKDGQSQRDNKNKDENKNENKNENKKEEKDHGRP